MAINSTSSNQAEFDAIKAIASSSEDGAVLMLNLNRYLPEADFPYGDLYRDYMSALDALLPEVGGKIIWRTPVYGQPVGEQPIDEILAAWYPTHQAFLDLPRAPGADKNFSLRRACLDYAVIHRCGNVNLSLEGGAL